MLSKRTQRLTADLRAVAKEIVAARAIDPQHTALPQLLAKRDAIKRLSKKAMAKDLGWKS